MTPIDLQQIATVKDLQIFSEAIIGAVKVIVEPAVESTAPDRYLKIKEVETYTGHKRGTIMGWLQKGKLDRTGKVVKLPYVEFSPGDYRILKSELEKFGRIGAMEVKSRTCNLKGGSRMKILGGTA